MRFFFNQDKRLVSFECNGESVAKDSCFQGKQPANMLAAYSPIFPATATPMPDAAFEKHVLDQLKRFPELNIELRENGSDMLLTNSVIGSSRLLRASDKYCTGVNVLDPKSIEDIAVIGGQHIGLVKDVTDGYVIQNTGRAKLVAHTLSNFEAPPSIGQELDIHYKDNKVVVKTLPVTQEKTVNER